MVRIETFEDFKRILDAPVASSEKELILDFGWPFCLPGKGIQVLDLVKLMDRFQGRIEILTFRNDDAVLWPWREGKSQPPCSLWDQIEGARGSIWEVISHCGNHLKQLDLFRCSQFCYASNIVLQQMTALESIQDLEGENGNLTALRSLLLRSDTTLREIKVSWRQQTDLEMQQFLEACQASNKLEKLDLGLTDFKETTLRGVGQLIRNTSSLRYLSVPASSFYFSSMTMTANNESPPRSLGLAFLAEDLKHNQSLQHFLVESRGRPAYSFYVRVTKEDQEEAAAFYEVLQSNYTLETMVMGPWMGKATSVGAWENVTNQYYHGCHTHKPLEKFYHHLAGIYFLISLNKAGRGKLLGPNANPKAQDWIEALAGQQDPSVFYFFLRHNPSLCSKTDSRHAPSGNKRRRTSG